MGGTVWPINRSSVEMAAPRLIDHADVGTGLIATGIDSRRIGGNLGVM